eukprot:scaffold2031_cov70-Phaeocystis_antarctica.AAC.1
MKGNMCTFGHRGPPTSPFIKRFGTSESGDIIHHANHAKYTTAHLGGIYTSPCRVDSPTFAFRAIFGLFAGPVGPRRVFGGLPAAA